MKTIEQHKKDGTFRKDRHANFLNFGKTKGIPEPPDTFTKEHCVYWYRYANALQIAGILSQAYIPTLTDVCLWEVEKDNYFQLLHEEKKLVNRHDQISPVFTALEKAQRTVMTLRAKLGVTPFDKVKIKAPTKVSNKEEDGFDSL